MPVMRTPDGKIIDPGAGDEGTEATRKIERRSMRDYARSGAPLPTDGSDEPTEAAEPPAASPPAAAPAGDSPATEPGRPRKKTATSPPAAAAAEEKAGGGAKTQLLRRSSGKDEDDDGGDGGGKNFMDDPVVGWLVVTAGPGRGASLPLGYGSNSLGRGPTERVRLDFGDELISRSAHTVLTYDPKGRKFFVQHGGGKNLTYINEDEPVLTPVELKGGEEIAVGDTRLKFVAFCGREFDWQDDPAK